MNRARLSSGRVPREFTGCFILHLAAISFLPHMSRHSRGHVHSQRDITRVRRFLIRRRRDPDSLSYRYISAQTGVPTTTVRRWDRNNSLGPEQSLEWRQGKKGAPRLLSYQRELVLAGVFLLSSSFSPSGRIVSRNNQRKDTRHCNTMAWALKTWGIHLSSSYLTEFCKRHHLSLKLPSKANLSEFDTSALQRGADFIVRIRRRCKSPEQLVFLDKTKFYSDARYVKHASPQGAYQYPINSSHADSEWPASPCNCCSWHADLRLPLHCRQWHCRSSLHDLSFRS